MIKTLKRLIAPHKLLNHIKMIIHEVLTLLENSTDPVMKMLQQSEHFKVIVLGFKKGMILKDHQTNMKTTLVVVKGAVSYKEKDRNVDLFQFDELDIPLHVTHAVHASEDSVCFLIRG